MVKAGVGVGLIKIAELYCKYYFMRKGVLMADNEPTDEELAELMHEVAVEAKRKATIAKQQLDEKIQQLFREAKHKK